MAVSQAKQIDFIKEIGPIAQAEAKKRGRNNAVLWTCIAQACDESAYGTSKRMRNSHAYFGIKANQYWIDQAKYGGLVYDSKTKECYDGKSYTSINALFRAYRNMEDSVADYFDLLEYNRYKQCLNATTVRDCITCIKAGGYSTAPNYVDTICEFYTNHKQLIEMYRTEGSNMPNHLQNRRVLKKGMEGSDAIVMQQKLIEHGYSVGKTGADGIFGTNTYNALKKFQKDSGIVVDGICGPVTWSRLG